MSTYPTQQTPSQQPTPQPIYPPRYGPSNPINEFQNTRGQQQPPSNFAYPTQQFAQRPGQYPPPYPPQAQQYPPPQGQFPPQQGYPMQNPYQNFSQRNAPQYNEQQPFDQQQQYAGQAPINPGQQGLYGPPPPIPPTSPLLRHSLSQVNSAILNNLQQFSPQFQQKFTDNQNFKSFNRKMVFIPSFLIMGHVLLNRNKKWFRLTVNVPLIRYSLIGLFMVHISTNVLYVAASRDLITRNRDRVEKLVVKEEFMSGTGAPNNRQVV